MLLLELRLTELPEDGSLLETPEVVVRVRTERVTFGLLSVLVEVVPVERVTLLLLRPFVVLTPDSLVEVERPPKEVLLPLDAVLSPARLLERALVEVLLVANLPLERELLPERP